MIVRCERCETRFKLDESRLPARGARVRCSRCKHAFFVIPPGSSHEDLVHGVAADAAATPSAAPQTPGATWDLDDGGAAPSGSAGSAKTVAPSAAETEEDNDWRFEDDVPGIGASEPETALDLTGSAAAPSFLAAADANEDSFADLGDPETWDLLADDGSAPPAASPSPEVVSSMSAAEPAPTLAPAVRAAEPPVLAEVPVRAAPPPAVTVRRATPAAARLTPAVRASGWAVATALSAIVAWASLSAPTSTPVVLLPVAGFEVTEARARILDNAAAGPLLIVSGRLRNPGSTPRTLGAPIRFQLLDAAGVPLTGAGASALAGPTLSTRRVREEAPEQLRAAQETGAAEFARRPVPAGAELSFEAVFGSLPRTATSVSFAAAGSAPVPGR